MVAPFSREYWFNQSNLFFTTQQLVASLYTTCFHLGSSRDKNRCTFQIREFAPEIIFISAGFDAHKRDPLASIQLETEDYKWVTDELCKIAQECSGGQVISVLEGGYNISALTASAIAHVGSLLR